MRILEKGRETESWVDVRWRRRRRRSRRRGLVLVGGPRLTSRRHGNDTLCNVLQTEINQAKCSEMDLSAEMCKLYVYCCCIPSALVSFSGWVLFLYVLVRGHGLCRWRLCTWRRIRVARGSETIFILWSVSRRGEISFLEYHLFFRRRRFCGLSRVSFFWDSREIEQRFLQHLLTIFIRNRLRRSRRRE